MGLERVREDRGTLVRFIPVGATPARDSISEVKLDRVPRKDEIITVKHGIVRHYSIEQVEWVLTQEGEWSINVYLTLFDCEWNKGQ